MRVLNHIFLVALCTLFAVFNVSGQSVTDRQVVIENSENLPNYIKNEISKIAFEAGDTRIKITSKSRSVEKQVEVMLDYYILCHRKNCGVELAKKTYHPDCNRALSLFDPNQSRENNVAKIARALRADLVELGSRRTCMNHVVLPEIKNRLVAVDIAPSSINNLKKFYDAVKNNNKVVRFYYPAIKGVPPSQVFDSAFHLEFYRQ
ncbi:hypothetical protein [Aliikangiella coralliicola]|uniref:Uncharacterized protein n=1 Tax=Aliikangiella coralliicola TaxID=2592383 RepID=A0A545UCU1_9GAMM|nr:hypothetical protein [Aliikangiella coralliicola]TQV87280.1 hypothetical protein FLL46_12575 [Aliikangiella coralliicola]